MEISENRRTVVNWGWMGCMLIILVGLLFLVLKFSVGELELVGEDLEILGELVLGLEVLGEQHQISRGVV